jgi:phosphoglycolate phosphatase
MSIRGLLFDKDGTLLDFEATWQPVYKAVVLHLSGGDQARADTMMRDAGYDFVQERCLPGSPLSAGTTDELVDIWRGDFTAVERAAAIVLVDDMFAHGAVEHMAPITDLRALLGRFAGEGYRLGIATNDVTRSAQMCVEKLALADLFSFVTGYDGVATPKPAPDMVHAFCAACGLEPREVAVVGDNMHDLEMGHAAGAGLIVGVLSGTGGRDDLAAHAHIVIDSIADLPQALADRR